MNYLKVRTLKKRGELLQCYFTNLSMNGDKLVFIMRQPFDMLLNLTDRQEWLLGRGSNPRPIG